MNGEKHKNKNDTIFPMEEKQTQKQIIHPELLPHLKTGEEVLSAIINLLRDLYQPKESTIEEVKVSNALLENLYARADELGVPKFEVARVALKGMPKNAQQDYFRELEDQNIYGGSKSLTPDQLLALKKQFTL